jgi:hypothetical protein
MNTAEKARKSKPQISQTMGAAEYDAQRRPRAIKNLGRKARKLGLQIVPTPV